MTPGELILNGGFAFHGPPYAAQLQWLPEDRIGPSFFPARCSACWARVGAD